MYTFEEESTTMTADVLRPPASQKRAPAGGYRTSRQRADAQRILDGVPRHVRASASSAYQEPRRADEQSPETYDDREMLIDPRRGKRKKQRFPRLRSWWRRQHWAFHLGVGACSILALWTGGLNLDVAVMNGIVIPLGSTHVVSSADISLSGHTTRIQPVVDQNNHVDVLLMRDGNIAHAQLQPGPQLFLRDPQHARLHTQIAYSSPDGKSITVIVTVEGPLQINGLVTVPEITSWQFDVATDKGGK